MSEQNNSRLMNIMVFVMLGGFALMHIFDLFLASGYEAQGRFGAEGVAPYSIFAKKSIYIAYQVWCVIVAAVTAFGIWKRHRILTYVGILLLLILLFYPLFTQA